MMPLFLSAILIWLVLVYQKKKFQSETAAKDALLREQALIIEKQTAIEKERNRISAEMHDDLGSGLTRIRFLSDKALRFATDNEEREEIKKIASHSNDLVRNMGEIIWAMNSRFDNAESLISYMRRFASEYLDENGIDLEFESSENEDNVSLSGEKRRNIFLVLKEILHNAVKYSGASKIIIHINSTPNFTIHIREIGGMGFDPITSSTSGNGIFNMQKRMANVGGTLVFEQTASGMETRVMV
ncbi:MAG: hypothetical protein IPN29_14430 [Saprospiraceae bacterium]|nr:hypothetical protein [Saprospiraceae bacterium]